jgi:hypothetical protein
MLLGSTLTDTPLSFIISPRLNLSGVVPCASVQFIIAEIKIQGPLEATVTLLSGTMESQAQGPLCKPEWPRRLAQAASACHPPPSTPAATAEVTSLHAACGVPCI